MDRINHLATKFILAHFQLITVCDSAELQLYLYLKLHAIGKHEAFPSFRAIRRDLDWSMAKIDATVRRMEQRGRLKVTRSQGLPSIYDLTWYDQINHPQVSREAEQQVLWKGGSRCSENQDLHNKERNEEEGTITPQPPKGGRGDNSRLRYGNDLCTFVRGELRIRNRDGTWMDFGGVADEHFADFRYGTLTGIDAYRAARRSAGIG